MTIQQFQSLIRDHLIRSVPLTVDCLRSIDRGIPVIELIRYEYRAGQTVARCVKGMICFPSTGSVIVVAQNKWHDAIKLTPHHPDFLQQLTALIKSQIQEW